MNLIELVTKIKEEEQKSGVKLPKYIDVEDINDSRLCVDGIWTTEISVWGICWKDGEWIYFETDNERGYISGIERYATEEEACKDTFEYMLDMIKGEQDGYTDEDFAMRYIQNEYGYSEEESEETVKKIMKQEDIFEEFSNYLVEDEFCNEDGKTVEVGSYSAKKLVEEEDFTPVAAYRFLVELRENREKAEKALRDGTVRKK